MHSRDRTGTAGIPSGTGRHRLVAQKRKKQPKDLGEREIEFVASTAKVASDGKIIREAAWESSVERVLAGGRKPRVLAAHIPGYPDGRQPVIGRIPPESIRIEPGVGLVHRIQFAPKEVHPEGPRYYAAYRDDYLGDVSVGWDHEVLAPESEWGTREIPEVSDLDWMDTSCVAFGADEGAVKRARAAGQYDVAALLESMNRTQRVGWEAFATRVEANGLTLTMSLLRELCAGCADAAIDKFGVGVQSITVREMPEGLVAAIRSKVAEPNFFQTCQRALGNAFGDDRDSLCAWLYRSCIGTWPGARDDAITADDLPPRMPEPVLDGERKVEEDHPDCPSAKPFALVSDSGKVLGCHESHESAMKQEEALKADAGADGDDDDDDSPTAAGAASADPVLQARSAPIGRRTRRVTNALSAGDLVGRLADAPNQRAALAPTFSQYLDDGADQLVTPTDAGAHRTELASGGYALVNTMRWPGFGFMPVRAETDTLAVFKDHPAERVLDEIDKFWGSGDRYDLLGLQHRRGLLLYGGPGNGKTACLHLVRERMAAAGEIVIDASASDPWMLREALHAIREVEPDRPITVIVEDVERWGAHGESELLAIMDGQHSVGRILLLASTNYKDQMSPRMLRHGRFDLHIEVAPPTAEARQAYLQQKTANIEVAPEAMSAIVEKTDGWSYSELREFVTAHFLHDTPVDDAVARIAPNSADDAPAPASVTLEAMPSDDSLGRLTDTIQQFAADRAESSQDVRILCDGIHTHVVTIQGMMERLPDLIAQRIAEHLSQATNRGASGAAQRATPGQTPPPITASAQDRTAAEAEENERQRGKLLLGNLSDAAESLRDTLDEGT